MVFSGFCHDLNGVLPWVDTLRGQDFQRVTLQLHRLFRSVDKSQRYLVHGVVRHMFDTSLARKAPGGCSKGTTNFGHHSSACGCD